MFLKQLHVEFVRRAGLANDLYGSPTETQNRCRFAKGRVWDRSQDLNRVDAGKSHSFDNAKFAYADLGVRTMCAGFSDYVLPTACQTKDVRCRSTGGKCTMGPMRGSEVEERAKLSEGTVFYFCRKGLIGQMDLNILVKVGDEVVGKRGCRCGATSNEAVVGCRP